MYDHENPRIISETIQEPSDPSMKNKFSEFQRVIRQNSKRKYTPLLSIVALFVLAGGTMVLSQRILNPVGDAERSQAAQDIYVDPKIATAFSKDGIASVIVQFVTTNDTETLSKIEKDDNERRTIVKQKGDGLSTKVKGNGAKIIRNYENLPYIVMEVTPVQLEHLKTLKGEVTHIYLNAEVKPQLSESRVVIKAHVLEQLPTGYNGDKSTVVVIDDGVEETHTLLQGQILPGACFGYCPNGAEGGIAGRNCERTDWSDTNDPVCGHGTVVASNVAAKHVQYLGKDLAGVAPGARIVPIRVVNRTCTNTADPNTCKFTYDNANILAALDWVYKKRLNYYPIAAVNISLSVNGVTSENCDATSSYKTAIDLLASVNIPVVAATGNQGQTTGVGEPACLTKVVKAAASYKNDTFFILSNRSLALAPSIFLAPGVDIVSAIRGNAVEVRTGTSYSAPHVAGALAILRQVGGPDSSYVTAVNALRSTATMISDPVTPPAVGLPPGTGGSFARIDIERAINLLKGGSSTMSTTTSCTATTGTSTTCNMPAATLGASTENEEVLGVETSDTETVPGEVLQATTQGTVYGKMMIATVAYIGDPSIPELQATSMTYCGATMSRLGGATGIANYSGQHLEMWYLFQPSGATCPLKANFTRSRTNLTPADPKDRILTRTVFDNVPNINFISGIVRIAGYKSPGSTFFDLRGLGAKNSRFVCSYSNYPNGGQNVVSTSGTQWKQIWTGKVLNNIQSAIGVSDLRTVDSQTMNIKWNGTQSQPWAGVCINLMQGATGGTTVPTPTPVPPTSVILKINGSDGPIKVKQGEFLSVSWFPVSANTCTASGGTWTGGKSITPITDGETAKPGTTTYKITCTGTRTISDSVVVHGTPKIELLINGSATEATIDKGIAPTLNWKVAGATSCTASGGWTGTKAIAGGSEKAAVPTVSTKYTLTCTGPGGTVSQEVTANLSATTAPIGYRAEYFRDPNFSSFFGTQNVSSINYDWGTTGVPMPGMIGNYYSARYTAQITPSTTGTYTFITTSDDGVRLFIDDKLVIQDWIYHGRTVKSGTMALTAGKKYNLVIEYAEVTGGATMIFQAGVGTNPAPLNPKATNIPLGMNGGGFTATLYTDNNYTTHGTTEHVRIMDTLRVTTPDTQLPYTFKSVRYGGYITPTVTSTYTFSAPSGAELYINGIKKTFTNGVTTQAMTANVTYPITLQTKLSTYNYIYLRWKYGTQVAVPVDFRNVRPSLFFQ